jgi:phosphoglycerol transferase
MKNNKNLFLFNIKNKALEAFSIMDLLFIGLLALSLTFCTKSPGIIKPEPKYTSSPSEGIVFSRVGKPEFVKRMVGLAGAESWGRWSDQDSVLIEFSKPLPPQRYIIKLVAKGFGPNLGAKTKIIAGSTTFDVVLKVTPETYTFTVDQKTPLNQIEIVPPLPTSPHAIDPNNLDRRRLGVGLIQLSIL